MKQDSKIIVLGAGVMGLSTTLSLLERDYTNVHLFDKRDYLSKKYSYFEGCDSPSSDLNKVFRSSYGSEVHYQKMSNASREKFIEWNKEIAKENWEGGEPIYYNTGNVHLTDKKVLPEFERLSLKNMPEDSICISDRDAEERAVNSGLYPCAIDPFDMRKRGKHLQGLLDTTGGMTLADKSCRWVLKKCMLKGKDKLSTYFGDPGTLTELLLEYNELTGGKKCVGIKTKDGTRHFCDHLIVCAGPWLSEIISEAGEKVEATGGSVCMIKIKDKATQRKYAQTKFPTWTYKVRDGALGRLYGFPCTEGYMKIGYRGLKWINPVGDINSKVKTKWSPEEQEANIPLFALKQIKNFIRENIPEVKKISMTRLCWYSDSSDNDYLISYCPYYEDRSVFVMAGDSGHAFMMLGSIGDVATDIINDEGDPFLRNLFSWERERETLNIINSGAEDPRCLTETVMASPKDWWIDEPSKL